MALSSEMTTWQRNRVTGFMKTSSSCHREKPKDPAGVFRALPYITKSHWAEASILRGHQSSSIPPSPELKANSALLESLVLYTSLGRPFQNHNRLHFGRQDWRTSPCHRGECIREELVSSLQLGSPTRSVNKLKDFGVIIGG